jgi:wobble nucleotide-excising tRNase
MIQQIGHIRDFGIYRNFQGGGLAAFAKCNLIYGWNYSGKTTLSRLFQILEEPDRIVSWPNSSFRILLSDGSVVTHASLATNPPPKTRVFNREFVTWNFAQEHTAPAVFILGAQNVALRQRHEQLNRRGERVAQLGARLQGRVAQLTGEIDQIGLVSRICGYVAGGAVFQGYGRVRLPRLGRCENRRRVWWSLALCC